MIGDNGERRPGRSAFPGTGAAVETAKRISAGSEKTAMSSRTQEVPLKLAGGSGNRPPLPGDAPLLSFEDVAAYLRTTPGAVRRLVDGRADGSDGELGDLLRSWLVRLSPRRRYVLREGLLSWLRAKSSDGTHSSPRG